MRKHGIARAAAKTDEQARAELGGHRHDGAHSDTGASAGGDRHGDEREPRLHPATSLKTAEQPNWLAGNHLQRAAVNLLIGDEGIGKFHCCGCGWSPPSAPASQSPSGGCPPAIPCM